MAATKPVNMFQMVRDGHRYVLMFDDSPGNLSAALREIGRWATNPELNFTWYDAAVLSGKIRRMVHLAY